MATVILGCKLPAGFTMELDGVSKKINGYNTEDGFIVVGKDKTVGLTSDVDKAFWDAWRTKFADHPICANQLVFEAKSESSAKEIAKETAEVKTGLEQKTPDEIGKSTGAVADAQ